MPTRARVAQSRANRLVRVGWIAVPVVICGFFVLCLVPDYWALVLRQLVFLVPLAVAALAIATIVRRAPNSAELRAWSLLGLCAAALLFSEVYFSVYQISVSAAGPTAPSAYDVLNFFAALCVLAALGVAAGLSRLPRATQLVLVADIISMSAVLFGILYAFWMWVLATPQTARQTGVSWAAYSSLGVAILLGVTWLGLGARTARDREVVRLLATSLSVFALGMVVWPLWENASPGSGPDVTAALEGSVVLFGYSMMMMAALTRLATVKGEWRMTLGRSIDTSRMRQSTIVSSVVLAASALMGFWAYRLPPGDGERGILVAAASVAIMALVARTGVATYEASAFRGTSSIDPVTGALNHRAFQEACDERIAAGRRQGTPFILVVADLDGFSRVNGLLGHAGGDDTLRAVVSALQSAGRRGSSVFRLSGDEFAVIGVGIVASEAASFATGLLDAVAAVEPSPGVVLSASIGFVACDGCDESKEELLRMADSAQVWAKYHGKGRAVAYDARIIHALGSEERLRLDEEQSYVGVARALAAAADARDARNYYHSRNVASLSVLLAEAIGLDAQHTRLVEIAAILHDVGRIAMPDPVMPSFKLGQRSMRADQEHAALGAQLVGALGVEGLPSWVRAHHECWDGGGFPDGLVGDAIPLESRIIALADAYDGMTAGRRGGSSMSKSAALQEIDHGIGTRFDPDLAERFIEVVGRTASLGWSDEWPAA